MTVPGAHYIWISLAIIAALILATAAINFVIIKTNGQPVAAPDIPRETEYYGSGRPLRYAVLGDSTTISQGSDYEDGYARATARHLAGKGYRVALTNYGVSGARAADVATMQAPGAAKQKPDVALIAVGANDVTHLTPIGEVERQLLSAIETLRAANPAVRIVITGSPQMGSISRFPKPAKALARLRSNQINHMAVALAKANDVTFAPIAAMTGPQFEQHPEYYAADNFHPNKAGYATWTPVLTEALDQAYNR